MPRHGDTVIILYFHEEFGLHLASPVVRSQELQRAEYVKSLVTHHLRYIYIVNCFLLGFQDPEGSHGILTKRFNHTDVWSIEERE